MGCKVATYLERVSKCKSNQKVVPWGKAWRVEGMHHGLLAGRRSRVLSFVQRDLLLPVAKLRMYWMAALGLVFWDPSGCPLEPTSFLLHSLHSQQVSIISLILFCPIFTYKDFQYSPKRSSLQT